MIYRYQIQVLNQLVDCRRGKLSIITLILKIFGLRVSENNFFLYMSLTCFGRQFEREVGVRSVHRWPRLVESLALCRATKKWVRLVVPVDGVPWLTKWETLNPHAEEKILEHK